MKPKKNKTNNNNEGAYFQANFHRVKKKKNGMKGKELYSLNQT